MALDYPLIWAGLIAFAVLAYVVLDGFDLGVGILFLWMDGERNRDQMMNSVAPVWDGNETWLVLGGGGLLATFPLAYAIVLPALYAPIYAMLLALTLRGVAFEFRWRTTRGKFLWDWAFCGGSTMAAFAQGVALGALVQGIPVNGRAYAGGWWDWLTPFSILSGVALVAGYALLGSTWLLMKGTGEVEAKARTWAKLSGLATLAMIGAVSLWTPFLSPVFMARWFAFPAFLYVAYVPILTLACAWALWRGLDKGPAALPFFAALGLFVLCYLGLGISFFPYIVPPSVTIWQAAAPDASLRFLLVGAVVLVPMILAYTAYSYWVFRGRVDPEAGYH
ncbi:MAG: cytochrome d ubiquinol oxidase subunit II [Hyphomicrobiales bacterium]|nr:cytochrome d ubiquinol oxidase subunit II [Hyphomicrobiales bacterium]